MSAVLQNLLQNVNLQSNAVSHFLEEARQLNLEPQSLLICKETFDSEWLRYYRCYACVEEWYKEFRAMGAAHVVVVR